MTPAVNFHGGIVGVIVGVSVPKMVQIYRATVPPDETRRTGIRARRLPCTFRIILVFQMFSRVSGAPIVSQSGRPIW